MTNTQRAAMQQALKAIHTGNNQDMVNAQDSLRAALAEPVVEPMSTENPDFITIPVEYQYHYPDGIWRCSNGDTISGMRPDRARSLYALRNGS